MVELRVNKRDLIKIGKMLKSLEPKGRASVWFSAMRKIAEMILRELIKNVSNRILRVRTGRLRASLGRITKITSDGIVSVVGSGVGFGNRVKYANILEVGGIIRPVNAKFLAVPLSGALTPAGVTKYPSARDYPNTFIRNKVIYQKQGRKVVPIFVLKSEVKIPAKKYLSRTRDKVEGRISRVLVEAVERAVRRFR